MTEGKTLVTLYEIGRTLQFCHQDALALAEQAYDKMYGELDILWYLVYFELRKEYTQDDSSNLADVYIAKVQELLDEAG